MPRPEKVEVVRQISERFKDADAALLTEYRGLRVADIAEVRTALREVGADYKVLKNTLARIAVREVGLEDLADLLEGPTAIAFVHGDAAAAAKALDEAARRFPVLVVKGGVLQGRVIDAAAAKRLASLESREVLLSKIAMLMNSPAQQTANVLSALLRNFGSMLAQVLAKKESGELPGGAPEAAAPPEPAAAEPEAPEATVQAEAATEAEPAAAERDAAEPEAAPAGSGETPDTPVADSPGAPPAADVVAPQPDVDAGAQAEAEDSAGDTDATEGVSVPEAEEQAAAAPESEAAEAATPTETTPEQSTETPPETKE